MGRKVILKDEATGNYVGKMGTWYLGPKEKARVFDWDADKVEESVRDVKALYGVTWIPEPVDVDFGVKS